MSLEQLVSSNALAPAAIAATTQEIYENTLASSKYLERANFTQFHTQDIRLLFEQYDRDFFNGECRVALGGTLPRFRISRRLTKAAGKTTRRSGRYGEPPVFEIAVSATLLFETFRDRDHRPIAVCGITCQNRLQAMQRILEHEIVHLIELLIWSQSSCSRSRFQSIAHRFFAHTDHRHLLITPGERALIQQGIGPGSRVRFRHDGTYYTGMVDRIRTRATVLVEDPHGPRYSDGKRYAWFYVPLEMLETID